MGEKKEEKIEISIDNTNSVMNIIEKGLKLLKEYGFIKILITIFMVAFISVFFYVIFNPTKIFEIYDECQARRHDELMDIRMDMAPKIQSTIDKLTYKVGASRTVILEMHNGSTGTGGLPFTKCTATYESLNIGKLPVSQYYQEQNLSLIPFATYLFNRGYWCGNTEDLLEIDKGLYYKIKGNNTDHFAACIIEGVDKPLAFMFVSFDTLPTETHECNTIRNDIRHVAMELALLIEVNNFKK